MVDRCQQSHSSFQLVVVTSQCACLLRFTVCHKFSSILHTRSLSTSHHPTIPFSNTHPLKSKVVRHGECETLVVVWCDIIRTPIHSPTLSLSLSRFTSPSHTHALTRTLRALVEIQ